MDKIITCSTANFSDKERPTKKFIDAHEKKYMHVGDASFLPHVVASGLAERTFMREALQ